MQTHALSKPALSKRIQGKTSQLAIDKQIRTARAIELRIAGLNYRDICNQLRNEMGDRLPPGYSEYMCSKDVQFAINDIRANVREKAQDMMELELMRLDNIEMVMMDKAMLGDVKAANMVLRIMERRSKYLGLDQPSMVRVKDWRSEVIELLKQGTVTVEDIRRELGDELAKQVLESGSTGVIEGREVEVEGEGEPLQDELAAETPSLGVEPADPIS